MKKISYSLFAILLTTAVAVLASPSIPATPPTNTPIDGGLTLIIGGGIAYAAKKYRDSKVK